MRPSKYDPAMCDKVVELGKQGASKAEMAAEIGISRECFNQYEKLFTEFSDAVSMAVHYSQAWWEKKGRNATFGEVPGFNATSFIFNMKNRFRDDWSDITTQNVNHSFRVKDILADIDGRTAGLPEDQGQAGGSPVETE